VVFWIFAIIWTAAALLSRNPDLAYIGASMGSLIWLFLALAAASYGARCFTADRASGALELLLSTPLHERAVAWGHFFGFWKLFGPFILAFVPAWWLPLLVKLAGEPLSDEPLILFGLFLLPFGLLGSLGAIVAWGMWVSVRVATTARAVVTTVVGMVAWGFAKNLVLTILVGMVFAITRDLGFGFVLFAGIAYFGLDILIGFVLMRTLQARLRARTRFGR
jgi:hypothetical protein